MNIVINKLLKSVYKIWGYLMFVPNFLIYKYYSPKTLIILGMHRSGTSCITRIFNLCNVYLGSSLMKSQDDNLYGFWENSYVFEINEKILKQSGGSWYNPPNQLKVTIFNKLAMLNVLYSSRGNVLGIKDPRMLITWEAWKPLINNYYIVGIYRHPLSVAKSLEKRNSFSASQGVDLWKQYNKKLIDICNVEDTTLIDFDDPDQLKDKIVSIIKKLDLEFKEHALNFYNPNNRNSDNINIIKDRETLDLYNSLGN